MPPAALPVTLNAAEEHGVVQVPRQVPVAPEALEVPQDLSQVSIAYTLDSDIAHDHWDTTRSALPADPFPRD